MTSVLNRITESLENFPSKIAIVDNDISYTYQELNLYSNKIANYLSRNQVQHESRVIFFMRRSFDMLATLLAIWKQGATYIPLDPKTPTYRIKQILENTEPACIISDVSLLSNLPNQNIPILTLNDPAFTDCDEHHNHSSSAKLAYIIYTSGSTGEPKGVMLTQDNLANHVSWLTQKFCFSSEDCFSFNSSMAFDFSVACTLLPLSIGAKIIITPEIDILDAAFYCQQLVEHKVTFAKWTPSYFRLIIDYAEQNRPDLCSFRFIMLAGEELLTSYAEKWFKIYPSHQLINEYGPTEAAVGITTYTFGRETFDKTLRTIPIGAPAINTTFYLVDLFNHLVEENEIGELLIGGQSVALGYHKQPELTAERFIENPFEKKGAGKLYRTGDLVKKLPDGNYLYIGRIDNQVKVNGFRIELTEIEHCILQDDSIKQAKIIVERDDQNIPKIIAYLVLKEKKPIQLDRLKNTLIQQLPSFMIPNQFSTVTHIPMNNNGKVDYKILKELGMLSDRITVDSRIPKTIDEYIAEFVKKHTGITNPDYNHTFFSLGLSSLHVAELVNDLIEKFDPTLKIQDIFLYPTIAALIDFLERDSKEEIKPTKLIRTSTNFQPIAIIGMDCRLPGADNCEALWELCKNGRESIEFFTPKEDKDSISYSNERTVYARGLLKDIDYFDADFFGFTARDAHLSDPQHRLLIESAWIALEKAGYIPELDNYKIGVYVSMNDGTYLLDHNLMHSLKSLSSDRFALQRLMSPQCLATKIAYTLNCTGPSLTIQTACSSSLVAIILASQQLSAYQCDIALAGGAYIVTPQKHPYTYQPGNIFSPDGHCRPFDAKAQGTVFSNGLGCIVLKRLEDALRDNDSIISVIKGVGINNDGQDKMSYTAPSVQGQMSCILAAQRTADIEASSIQYVEAHGTGTLIGDPIEIEALSRAFRKSSKQQQFCAIGSLKANIGHTHVAAGVAGLIKVSLALHHHLIPPSINFEQPNPSIDWENSPFYVNKRLQHWIKNETPRRAAVSAFGVGGTNAHVIVEEAPVSEKSLPSEKSCILLLSAKSEAALQTMQANLIQFFKMQTPHDDNSFLADIAYTLQVGRKKFDYKTGVVCNNLDDAILSLEQNCHTNSFHFSNSAIGKIQVVFLFPGQGTEYVNLSRVLYKREPIYQECLDDCLELASCHLTFDLRSILFPTSEMKVNASAKIHQTEFTHPILFSVEYALAKLLIAWGIKPDYMLGHSLGEYVAACLSGVFSLEDAIKIVCARGKAIASSDAGAMLVTPLSEEEARLYCEEGISLAAINADDQCVFSGTEEAIQQLHQKLAKIKPSILPMLHKLKASRPFHSQLLMPVTEPFLNAIQPVIKHKPTIPYLSNVSGDWVSELLVKQDSYWIEQLRSPVQFSRCVKQLNQIPNTFFIEVGPGKTLLSLIKKQLTDPMKSVHLLPSIKQQENNEPGPLIEDTLKKLWCYGYPIDWHSYHKHEKRRRVSLPTYPFEKKRFWFDEIINVKSFDQTTVSVSPSFYVPTWVREANPLREKISISKKNQKIVWIVFVDDSEICARTISQLKKQKNQVYSIERGQSYANNKSNHFIIQSQDTTHYERIIQEIVKDDISHYAVIHFWSMEQTDDLKIDFSSQGGLYNNLYSGLFLIKAFYQKKKNSVVSCVMISNQLQLVLGNEKTVPSVSTILSLCRVLSLENKNYRFSSIDIDYKLDYDLIDIYSKNILNTVLTYLYQDNLEYPYIVAYRHGYSWKPSYQTIDFLEQKSNIDTLIQTNGFYCITGGLGAMGLTLAEWIADQTPVKLLLLSRKPLPVEKEWNAWLRDHPENDNTSDIIRKLKNILTKGSSIIVKSADVSDYRRMKFLMGKLQKQYGDINGIFHLAGVPGDGLAIMKDTTNINSTLLPKIQGTLVLSKLFKKSKLDFLVCASSLTAIAGGVGQLDYCAANLFLDYFASKHNFKGCKRLLTINWNSWSSIGMATHLEKSKVHEKLYLENSVSPKEAMHLLASAFETNQNQIIISKIRPELERKRIIAAFDNSKKTENFTSLALQSAKNTYEAVREIWQSILGIQTIKEDDTFYSLGGDSLSTIELLVRLEEEFKVNFSLQEFAHATTLKALTKLIEIKPIHASNIIVPLVSSKNNALTDHELTFYFIHPLGGTLFNYFSLARYLINKESCYGIQDPELAKGETLFHSIKEMAETYVEEIKSHQPMRGKIVLVGTSFGGNIAVEMVSSLRAAGYFIQKVILIDSWANLRDAKLFKERNSPSFNLESLKIMKEYYGAESHQYQSISRRLEWLRSYTPSKVNVEVILLAAEDLLPLYKGIASHNNGWDQYMVQPILKYIIKGNHDTMLQPDNLPALGERLNALI